VGHPEQGAAESKDLIQHLSACGGFIRWSLPAFYLAGLPAFFCGGGHKVLFM